VTEPSSLQRRLAELRARRAAAVADRAAFEARRRHGLAARHRAKLAYLAHAAEHEPEPDIEEEPPPEEQNNDAA
jgi:hypothetical protein